MPKTNNKNLDDEYSSLIEYPILLRSFRAHIESINGICFIDEHELIITSSSDLNIRIFTLTGRYVGLFGQQNLWDIISIKENNSM